MVPRVSSIAVWPVAIRCATAGLALVVALARLSAGQPPAPDPSAPLVRLHAGLLAAAAAGWPPEPATVERLVRDSFDLPRIVSAVLGNQAASATAAQRQRLSDVLSRRMVRELMRRKPVDAGDLQILGARSIGADEWLITTRVVTPQGDAAILQWRVRARREGLRIVDGLRDGASAVITMRQEIAEALRRRSLDDVIAEIERRDQAVPR